MTSYIKALILWFNYLVISYYTVANAVYLVLLALAVWLIAANLRRLAYGGYHESLGPLGQPPVSVLIAAYNEESNIVETVRSLFRLNYPDYEVIVVNDGSEDGTLERLISRFGLKRSNLVYRPIIPTARVRAVYVNPEMPNFYVVDKAHSGKADSLNAGINLSGAPYFCSVDADSVLEDEALTRLMRPIVENPGEVRATGGIVRIINGCAVEDGRITGISLPKDSLSRFQVVEYIRSFLFGRAGLSALNSLLIISGTFSMFHKKSVADVGGYRKDTVTEDMELVVRLHRHLRRKKERYRVTFVPDPICWTEAPSSFAMLARQRKRWHTGLAESLIRYRSMLFNPAYGRVGLFAMPYHLLIELFGPVVEIFGYAVVASSFAFGLIGLEFFMLFLVLAVLVGVFFSTGAVLLEEITYRRYPRGRDLFILLVYGVLENFGYRQAVSFWRVQALLRYVFLGTGRWEVVEKKGFDEHTHPEAKKGPAGQA